MSDKTPYCPSDHPYIKTGPDGAKKIEGAAALAFKGIKKGTETKTDKNGVAGTWKDAY